MYKGYKDIRSFYNAKIHALAINIAGAENERVLIQTECEQSGFGNFDGVSKLTDSQAESLYKRLTQVIRSLRENMNEAKKVRTVQFQPSPDSSSPSMTLSQRRTIIKLTRYVFEWTIEYTFSKIIETVPALRQKLTGWELNNSRIGRLYSVMSKADADKVIKRLSKIEKKKQ